MSQNINSSTTRHALVCYISIHYFAFAIETGYYCNLNICIYNLQCCYETSRQKKNQEKLDIIKV